MHFIHSCGDVGQFHSNMHTTFDFMLLKQQTVNGLQFNFSTADNDH